jgi:hypothetical protein
MPAPAARTITALLTLRDQLIAPILAGVRSPRPGRKPAHWTATDRSYESLRIGMQTLFGYLGIDACAPWTTHCRYGLLKRLGGPGSQFGEPRGGEPIEAPDTCRTAKRRLTGCWHASWQSPRQP